MKMILDRPCIFKDGETEEPVVIQEGEREIVRVPSPEGLPFEPWLVLVDAHGLPTSIGYPEHLLSASYPRCTRFWPQVYVTIIP